MKINKQDIVDHILIHIDNELNNVLQAAESAHLAATDDQSVAETQYDTLAIEASYLAHGHSERADNLLKNKFQIKNLKLLEFCKDDEISIGALIKLDALMPREPNMQPNQTVQYFFIAPCSGGLKIDISDLTITVITQNAPIAQQLLGLYEGDEFNAPKGIFTISEVH